MDEIAERRDTIPRIAGTAEITELIYSHAIGPLQRTLSEYLSNKQDVWLLFDNLDKGWPVQGARTEDILILRSLLEATRKLQRQLERRGVEFHTVVFIRNDIYEHLLRETPDKGKDTAIILDWNDPEVFKEIIRRRMIVSINGEATFGDLWNTFFDSHVHGEESFSYILNRTLRRPREVLRFARESISVAVNRNHDKVAEEDILQAEKTFSEDTLVEISSELKDVNPSYPDALYAFIGAKTILSRLEVETLLRDEGKLPPAEIPNILELLLWFGFLGIYIYPDEERYSYQFEHNPKKMRSGVSSPETYCIHPAVRKALGCRED